MPFCVAQLGILTAACAATWLSPQRSGLTPPRTTL